MVGNFCRESSLRLRLAGCKDARGIANAKPLIACDEFYEAGQQ